MVMPSPKAGKKSRSRCKPKPEVVTGISSGWKAHLLVSDKGKKLPVLWNAITALRCAEDFQGVLAFNECSLEVTILKDPFGKDLPVPCACDDVFDNLTAAWLQKTVGIIVGKEIAGQAINTVAREHPFHPIRNYLNSLKWDGVARIDNWLGTYAGVELNEYSGAVGSKFLISAVARIYRPGCKVDTVPILEGLQGLFKSTLIRALFGPEFFTDDIAELGSKDSVMQMRGKWVLELGELDALSRVEQSRIKAFISRQVDRIRLPYGKRVSEFPRECVFVGTVNKETYLNDETGGRRFWPVKCGELDIEGMQRDRNQLWAEARDRFKAGETWWFDKPVLVSAAAEQVAERRESDPWDSLTQAWVQNPVNRCCNKDGSVFADLPCEFSTTDFVTVEEILTHCIQKPRDKWEQRDYNRVARSLIARGWKRKQKDFGKDAAGNRIRPWGYFAPSSV